MAYACGRGKKDRHTQTHTQTCVTTIHFASSTTHAKCNDRLCVGRLTVACLECGWRSCCAGSRPPCTTCRDSSSARRPSRSLRRPPTRRRRRRRRRPWRRRSSTARRCARTPSISSSTRRLSSSSPASSCRSARSPTSTLAYCNTRLLQHSPTSTLA